jgi:hypothetical protein
MKKYIDEINLVILVVLLVLTLYGMFAAGVSVRVFQSHATGGLVYCRTGSLPASSHEDLGTATVPVSQVVDCP